MIVALAALPRLACTGQHARKARCTRAPARAVLLSSACPHAPAARMAPRSPAGAARAEAAAAAAPPASSCQGALLHQVLSAPATRSRCALWDHRGHLLLAAALMLQSQLGDAAAPDGEGRALHGNKACRPMVTTLGLPRQRGASRRGRRRAWRHRARAHASKSVSDTLCTY